MVLKNNQKLVYPTRFLVAFKQSYKKNYNYFKKKLTKKLIDVNVIYARSAMDFKKQ